MANNIITDEQETQTLTPTSYGDGQSFGETTSFRHEEIQGSFRGSDKVIQESIPEPEKEVEFSYAHEIPLYEPSIPDHVENNTMDNYCDNRFYPRPLPNGSEVHPHYYLSRMIYYDPLYYVPTKEQQESAVKKYAHKFKEKLSKRKSNGKPVKENPRTEAPYVRVYPDYT